MACTCLWASWLNENSNECKRRKIKCNGQSPCQRCGNLNLECMYAPNCCNNFKESESVDQGAPSTWRTRLTWDAASSSKCRRISRRFSSKSMTSTTTLLPSGRRWMYRATTPAQSAHLSTAETFSNPRCCLLCLRDREPNPSASTHASMAQHRAHSISAWPGRA
jgi:hypothetical protein